MYVIFTFSTPVVHNFRLTKDYFFKFMIFMKYKSIMLLRTVDKHLIRTVSLTAFDHPAHCTKFK